MLFNEPEIQNCPYLNPATSGRSETATQLTYTPVQKYSGRGDYWQLHNDPLDYVADLLDLRLDSSPGLKNPHTQNTAIGPAADGYTGRLSLIGFLKLFGYQTRSLTDQSVIINLTFY